MNNPASQTKKDWGPIPKGNWKIGDWYWSKTYKQWRLGLEYLDGEVPGGRTLIAIHPGQTSYGCILLSEEIVNLIGYSGDNRLVVGP